MNTNYDNCVEGCSLPSSPNDIKIMLTQIKREVDKLVKDTNAKLLLHDGKIAEACRYIKDNLSNSIRCLLDSMMLSGELSDIINEAIINEIKIKFDYFINVKQYGALGNGVKDDTIAIQRAINESNYVYIPDGTYCFKKLNLRSDLVLIGNNATLKCLNTEATGNDASIKPIYTNNEIKNVRIEGITFDGNKDNINHSYYDVIGFFALNSEVIKNISVVNCHFNNFKEDAIRFMYSPTANISNISVKGCTFDGVTNINPSLNGIRFVMDNYVNTYGMYPVRYVYIHDCTGNMIRTLADIKRGCENVIITDCFTHNMNDCHNSIDGSKNVIVSNIISSMDSDFLPTTGANFIEVQGEDILIQNIVGEGSNKVRDGLQVTDYGHPNENGLGHNSKNITISKCTFKNITRNGYNVMNGNNIKVSECSIENAGAHSYVFNSGDGRNDSSDNKLVAGLNHCVNSNELNCVYGIAAKNQINNEIILKVENVKNENGFLNIYNTESTLTTLFMEIVKDSPINLNPELGMEGSNVKYYNASNVTVESITDKNLNCYNGLQVTDSLTDKLGELQCACKFKAKKNDVFTISLDAKKVDTNYFSILIKEYQDSTWLSNKFIASPYLGEGWKKYIAQCTIQNEQTNHVIICLVPASGYNDPTGRGSLKVSSFEVYKI